jgi:hypothetical protein
MIAHRLIEDAKAVGLTIEVDGGDLIVEADCDPPDALIERLRAHKAEVIAFLLPRPAQAEGTKASIDADGIGEPALLRDGRRLHRFRADRASMLRSEGAAGLVDEARFHGAVLIADGPELIVVERWLSVLPEETLRALKDRAGSVISVLLGESQARCAVGSGR